MRRYFLKFEVGPLFGVRTATGWGVQNFRKPNTRKRGGRRVKEEGPILFDRPARHGPSTHLCKCSCNIRDAGTGRGGVKKVSIASRHMHGHMRQALTDFKPVPSSAVFATVSSSRTGEATTWPYLLGLRPGTYYLLSWRNRYSGDISNLGLTVRQRTRTCGKEKVCAKSLRDIGEDAFGCLCRRQSCSCKHRICAWRNRPAP